jgi:protein TonB
VKAEMNLPEASHRLLIGLMVASLGLHLLFLYLGDGLRPERTAYIEFTLQDASPAVARAIPRPRIRNKIPDLRHAPDLSARKHSLAPARMDPVARPEPVRQEMDMIPDIPDAPDVTGLNAAEWAGGSGEGMSTGTDGGITRKDYFEMVRFKIESRKKYPASARARQIEGRVTVGFAMDTGGRAADVRVVKSSGHESLDQAAVEAVRSASPFPVPPQGMIKNTIPLEVVIAFELT